MDSGQLIFRFLHDLGGAAWFGASLFVNLVVLPYILAQPPDRQRALVRGLLRAPERLIIAAALLVSITGLGRGLTSGRLGADSLATQWAVTWLAAIVVIMLVFAVGGLVTSPAMRRLIDDDTLWTDDSSGGAGRVRAGQFTRLARGFRLELAGITVAMALMVVLAAS